VAALITAVISNSGSTYDVVYHGRYDSEDQPPPAAPTSGSSTAQAAS
jgi:hypothetical protein